MTNRSNKSDIKAFVDEDATVARAAESPIGIDIETLFGGIVDFSVIDFSVVEEDIATMVAMAADPVGVLVVDDEPEAVEEMTEHLSMMGFRSFGASGAWDALDLVNREPDIAIAIIDLKMPGMDGMGLVRRLRQDPARNIQCIMVSGHGTMDDVQQAMHEQVREFLIKPINSNELFDGVSRLREEIANRRGGFA